MRNREDLMFDLKLVDNLVGITFGKIDLAFYFAGGSACILAGYIDRTTRDFDFVDRGYSAQLSKVLKLLEPYDLLTNYFAAIPRNYAERAEKVEGFTNISIYIFSREDIIASKIDRMSEKDLEDMQILMNGADKSTLEKCIQETMGNIVYENRRLRYKQNLLKFNVVFKL